MKKYDEYKDSGVAWIGEVPKHWEVIPFKRAMTINNGSDYKHIQVDVSGYPVIGSGGEFARASQYVYDGEVVLLGRKGTIDKPMYYNGKFWTVDTMFYAIPKKYINCKYLYYQALNIPFERYATATALPSMTQTDLNMNVICLPPTIEQTAIATYLDTHCAKIDNLISIQQKRIALLQELKQSVITHAVTKGLNPNVEMKPSGVEWIGDVPKHWKLVRTRYLCNLCTGSKDTINRVDDGKYPFYVRSPKVERIDTYSFDGEAILMAGDGVGAGKVFHYAVGKFDYHQRVYNFHNFKHVLGKFFYNYISNNFKYIIEEGGAKNTVDSVRLYMIQNFMTTVPPLEEQMEICNYIEQKEKVFDTSISNAQHQIDLLQEYKQSLITEVVTGKYKVC